ncbi:hypothetical protein BCV70DRAFT_92734 [Testicularia cyperi]|uniref:Uncharacterized protein n=1 Tax=Testicularia cyperi TaxID=1882483 RepID=A0A317XGI3_9BASI|nr:hypothetical protein BCV70DRAFT_92734 [Testicularia cyperi]
MTTAIDTDGKLYFYTCSQHTSFSPACNAVGVVMSDFASKHITATVTTGRSQTTSLRGYGLAYFPWPNCFSCASRSPLFRPAMDDAIMDEKRRALAGTHWLHRCTIASATAVLSSSANLNRALISVYAAAEMRSNHVIVYTPHPVRLVNHLLLFSLVATTWLLHERVHHGPAFDSFQPCPYRGPPKQFHKRPESLGSQALEARQLSAMIPDSAIRTTFSVLHPRLRLSTPTHPRFSAEFSAANTESIDLLHSKLL